MPANTDVAISQEMIDRACEALRKFAEAIHEMFKVIVQAWRRFVEAVKETFGSLFEWVREAAIEAERHGQWPARNQRAPRVLGRNDAMRASRVRQWRWSPLYGRR